MMNFEYQIKITNHCKSRVTTNYYKAPITTNLHETPQSVTNHHTSPRIKSPRYHESSITNHHQLARITMSHRESPLTTANPTHRHRLSPEMIRWPYQFVQGYPAWKILQSLEQPGIDNSH
jgi:hypothetical protein